MSTTAACHSDVDLAAARELTPFERRRQRWIRAHRLGRDEIADLPPHFDPGGDYDVAPANEEPTHG